MILYAVVARAKDGIILVESMVAGVEGNFPQITVEVLDHVVKKSNAEKDASDDDETGNADQVVLLPEGGRRTFKQTNEETSMLFGGLFSSSGSGVAAQWNCWMSTNSSTGDDHDVESSTSNTGDLDYYFHLYRKENIICLCISDDTDIRYHVVNYDFLDDVVTKFTKSYASYAVTKAKAYEMEKKFNIELSKIIYYYNEHRSKMIKNDKINHLLGKVDNLKGLLGHNITMVLERDQQLNDMVVRSEHMMHDSKVFTKRSSQLKKKMRIEYYWSQIIAVAFGILVVYLFFAHICGYTGGKCSSNYNNGGQE